MFILVQKYNITTRGTELTTNNSVEGRGNNYLHHITATGGRGGGNGEGEGEGEGGVEGGAEGEAEGGGGGEGEAKSGGDGSGGG